MTDRLTADCSTAELLRNKTGAGDEGRTRDLLLGKQTHYHCATPAWCLDLGSNQDSLGYQPSALPLSYLSMLVLRTGFDPASPP